jgi:hypothetical protein
MNQMYVPPMTRINKIILIAYAGLFLANAIVSKFMGFSLVYYLGLSASGVNSGFINQFITYSLIETGL